MDALGFIFTVGIVVVGGILIWTNTKSGKKMAGGPIVFCLGKCN